MRTPLALLIALTVLTGACREPPAGNRSASAENTVTANIAAAVRGCGRHGTLLSDDDAARPVPRLTGRVVDGANLLSPAVEQRLVRELASLEAATTDQLVVVTIPALNGESIETLGLRLGNGWGIGQRNVNNGVLLIVAPQDRKVRIEVGCGLEGLLTDERAHEIIQTVLLPHFSREEFEQGVQAGVNSIDTVLRSDRQRPKAWQGTTS